ncbi:MAG TPA: glycosyltransferase family 1 protein [Bacteroidales bacterium]|nr:glycosyltransferase family 1 protein [Bacteroidales bacterium]
MKTTKKIMIIGTMDNTLYGFRGDFIKECIKNGHQVHVLVSEYSQQGLKKIESLGAVVSTYKLSRGGLNPLSDLASTWQLKNKIKSIQPDIVFPYSTKPVIYGTLAAYHARVPSIFGMIEGLGSPFTIHKHKQKFKSQLTRFMQVSLYRWVFRYLDKIMFLNQDDPRDLIDNYNIPCKPNAVEVIGPIGLNLADYAYSRWDESQPVSFIFIARLIAEKGIFDFIEAAKIVKQQHPDAIFKIIGGLDPANPSALSQTELDELIASGLIQYDGYVSAVAQRIKESAVFVLPSYYREGVPRSTQEAMAVGRPVITTDVPGCRDTVVPGVNGFLIPKWNAKVLANKMLYFIHNPDQVNLMGMESFKIASAYFDVDKVNKKILNIMGLYEKK